jgi:hypothetical protein
VAFATKPPCPFCYSIKGPPTSLVHLQKSPFLFSLFTNKPFHHKLNFKYAPTLFQSDPDVF